MKFKNFFALFCIYLAITSCSKDTVKKSIINEKNLELQVREAYLEGKKELESGDVLFAAKNLMKQKFYSPIRMGTKSGFDGSLCLLLSRLLW